MDICFMAESVKMNLGAMSDNENTKYCNSINSRLCYRIFVSANQSKSDN